MIYSADCKRYDPDHQDGEDFQTWDEAAEWLLHQYQYGMRAMWINDEKVEVVNGVIQTVRRDLRVPTNPQTYSDIGAGI